MNVNVNVGVRVTVSVSVNVCRGCFKRGGFCADSRRSVEVDVAPAVRIGVLAPGGSYVVWDHSPCVWFCLCRPIETTLPTGVWDQQRSRCETRRCEAGQSEGVRFAWRSFPNGLYQKKAKIDFGVS